MVNNEGLSRCPSTIATRLFSHYEPGIRCAPGYKIDKKIDDQEMS